MAQAQGTISANDLMYKLVNAKKVMDKVQTGSYEKGNVNENFVLNSPEEIDMSQAQPNLNRPVNAGLNVDKINNSKLPAAIKQAMIEHPIDKPQLQQPVLSDEIVEKASRLMNTDASGKQITENIKKNINNLYQTLPKTDTNDLKAIIRETMEEVLKENGLLIESVNKTNQSEVFTFKVGKHIFEGKVTKIKKVQ